MQTLTLNSSRDVIDFVNAHPTGSRRGRVMAFVALGSIFIDAYDFTSLAIGIPSLQTQLAPSSFQLGTITAIMAVGALLGAIVGGYLVDRLGRFKLLILDLFLFVVAAIGAGLAPDIGWLLVFRFLLGFGVGVDMPAALSFVTEFSRSDDKGKYVNFWQLIWYVATVFSAGIILPLYFLGVGDDLWRWAVGIGALPALIVLILRFIYADESPMWAAHHQGLEAAAVILRKNYGVHVQLGEAARQRMQQKVDVRAIFRVPYRARTILSSTVSGIQAMEYYAVGFYIPVIVSLILGKGIVYTVLGTIAINIFGIVGGGTQPFFTRRLGVRGLAIIGCCVAAGSLILLGLIRDHVSVYLGAALVGVFILGHSFGPGSQGKTMAALSYPTEFRGVGTGMAEASSRVGTIFGFYVFPLVLAAVGLSHTLLILAVVPLVGLIALLSIKWEPVGQDVEDVAPYLPTGSASLQPG